MREFTDKTAGADALRAALEAMADEAARDPILNPVRTLASRLFLSMEAGDLSLAALGAAVDELEVDGFAARAAAFHAARRDDAAETDAGLAAPPEADFDAFRAAVERTPIGVVFTAHPTFAITPARRELIADYPSTDEKIWKQAVAETPSGAPADITLADEHDEALAAVAAAQDGVAALNRTILETARSRFPEQWRTLRPTPVSVASWVGYDLDGRNDIRWGHTVNIRLREKAIQLARYVRAIDAVGDAAGADVAALRDMLDAAAQETRRHAALFTENLADPDSVVAAANALTENTPARLTTLKPAIATLGTAIDAADDDETAMALSILRSEMMACGLGAGRIHLRVNAAQVRSALRSDLGLDPDTDFKDRSALDIASEKARSAAPRGVNFGSVFLEQMTARRQLMLCAQILKHIDEESPIRFLIAECEAPATVMGAVYLARLYGVDHKLDISPLFETPSAVEGGGRFIERLLSNPEYRAYVERRGRMSIQIGYSDSGRFMGQATASLASERLQVLFARALAAAGLDGVEALVFNTHGESMGRGAYPGGYRARLDHLTTPWVRSLFQRDNIALATELSFQGGEGYLHFQTPALAETAITTLWTLASAPPKRDAGDRFYQDINFSWDIYRALKNWQETLYARDDYRDVIFSFAQNLLFKTGSREVKRAQRGVGAPEIRSIRAIPHNAILQQLGAPVNVSGGVGAAAGREIDRFIEHVSNSPRMTELVNLAATARDVTSVTMLRAYAGLYSPAYWSALAGMSEIGERADVYESVLQVLQQERASAALSGLCDFLARDLRAFDGVRAVMSGQSRKPNGAGVDIDLGVLHAIRQALIGRAAALVAGAPSFSRRHDVDRNDIIELALAVRLDDAAQILEKIFPRESPAGASLARLAEKVDGADGRGGAYPEIHDAVIAPLRDINAVHRRIGAAIANHYRAYG